MTLQGVKRKVVTVSDFRFTGRLLGKGNFARVEEAVHSVLNVKVAIKIIDIKEIKEKYVVKNLHREARIMASLNHPCIVSLFQTMQTDDNIYYLVTELVSGGDLCSFIIGQRYGKLEERPARVYARQFASALAHMHSFGIVHRDLKMENVMLNASQTQIKIVDFGLSNIYTHNSPLRTHCGSPEYAAPELFIAGREYGPEVDLWSLGIIFYGMVVGQLPFVGGRKNQLSSQERRKKLVAQINKGLGAAQRQAIAPLSPDFKMMLTKLLAADPLRRLSSKELLVHPWITEKGKRSVQKHPLKELDNAVATKVMKQLGEVFQIEKDAVSAEIAKNPYGRLGGMFNVLSYKSVNEHFNLDQIAPLNKTETPAKIPKPKSASLAKSQHTFYNQCIVLLNKVSKQQVETRAKTANAAKNVKLSRTKVDKLPSKPQSSKTPCSRTPAMVKRKIPEYRTPTLDSIKKISSTKIQIVEKPTSASNARRPFTATKRNCASAAAATTCKDSTRDLRRQIYADPTGMGDILPLRRELSNVRLRRIKNKNHLANEPIARSIAGYLVNNVPNNMFDRMRK